MDLFKNLNEAQKEVVQHGEGPMLVIAGAGTGKTKAITHRILHLLESGVHASQILALTFTEKATREMQERVYAQLPISHEEIQIKTFHSFCDYVLKERAHEIGLSPSYRLLDQMNQWLFMKKNLFKFNLDYYRPLGNPSKFIWSLLQHFSRLKDENIGPKKYLEYAEAFKADDDVQEEEKRKLLELANAYREYQSLMIRESLMDFGDLTFYALKLFEARKSVLKEYQEQFKYILVDEFQDTNFAQSELVFLLSEKHQNIVVVGDDDQSIYKWRGASLSNIVHFKDKFPNAESVVLKKNYRSTQNILDASYNLIQNNNPDRLELREGIDKRLESQVEAGEKVSIAHFESIESEVNYTLQKITELKERSDEISYTDFAILLRTNALAEPYVEALKHAGIPFKIKNPRGFFRTEIVKDILALFRILQDKDDDVALFRLLSMPIFELSEEFLQDCLAKARRQSCSLNDLLKDSVNELSLPGLEEKYAQLFNVLNKLNSRLFKNSVGQIIYSFLEELGVMKNLQDQDSPEKVKSLEHLSLFSRFVAQFDAEHRDANPKEFLDYISLLEEADMSFDLESDVNENAVNLLTVHSSKGLEFEYVFVGSLVQQRFPGRNVKDAFDIPLDLVNEVLPEKDYHLEEERRLMYVAMTRARKQLFLTYSDYYAGKKQWKPSKFVEEVRELDVVQVFENPKVEVLPQAVDGHKVSAPRKHRSLKRFSYSQFDTFKTCPLKYKFRYVFKLSPPPSHASQFGSSVHNALNDFYQLIKQGQEPPLEVMKELYEKNWLPYGYTSKTHQLARKKKGWEMLEAFYEKNSLPNWVVPAFLERPFSLKIGEAIVSGRIDRIDKLRDGTYEVIDYKTGKSKMGKSLRKDLQLGVYAMACTEILKLKVSKLSLYFLDDNVVESINIEDLDLAYIRESLSELCTNIPQSEFEATPGFACGFCDYRLVCAAASSKVV